MKVALVYDHVNKIGGAERILVTLSELFPKAPLFTLVYDKDRAPWASRFKVVTSFLQNIPLARRLHEFFPILPIFAFEKFDFSQFDVVISVTSSEAKGIVTSPQTLHICYLLTPTRYLWSHYQTYFKNGFFAQLTLPLISYLRLWDQTASSRPDTYVSISKNISLRLHKYYRRTCKVIYPPVDIDTFKLSDSVKKGDYFLVVSRLVQYKHIELAILACNKLKLPLKIVGSGLDRKRLEKISGATIEFLGNLTDQSLIDYYQSCRALLFPSEEDLGLTLIEALACGTPGIAYGRGGALEILNEGQTGEFFYSQTADALIKSIKLFMTKTYNPQKCRTGAEKFAKGRFKNEFSQFIKEEWSHFKGL